MAAQLKVALTHDVDRTTKSYQYTTHLMRALKKGDLSAVRYHATTWHKRRDVYWNFEDIMEVESNFGVRSTFFFLLESLPFRLWQPKNWKLSLGRYKIDEPHIQEIIKKLFENGWEIGLHGSWASYKNLHLLKKEKSALEKVLGAKVIGIRQHYLNMSQNTWLLQKQAGFLYDSSWGYTTKVGFKEDKVKPFSPFNNRFTVYPMAIMDSCYMSSNERKKLLRVMIEKTLRNNAILVINWHSNNFNPNDYPGYRDAYIEIIKTCINHSAIFNTLSGFYNTKQQKTSSY